MNKKTIVKLLKRMRPYMPLMILSLVAALIVVGATLVVPVIIGNAIDFIVAEDFSFEGLFIILSKIVGISLFIMIVQWIMNLINNKATSFIVRDIRNDLFDKIATLPLSYLDSHPQGDIVSRMIADADQFADGLLMGFTQAFTGIITIVGTLVFMLNLNVAITLVVVVLTPLSLLVANFISKKTFYMFKDQSTVRGNQTAFIDEMLSNEKVVKAFAKEKDTCDKFNSINDELRDASLKAIFYSSLTNPGTRFVYNVIYAFVALFGAFSVINGNLTIGMLACFLGYVNQYTKPFNEITSVITELQNAFACVERIFELLETDSEIPDDENAYVIENTNGVIDVNNVDFSYVKDRKLIENFNLHVNHGERAAIVGPTGCGKTTIINLLMRFYDTDKGEIAVDGHDIKHVTRESLRTSYGMVLQETWLKNGTIRENIAMGKPDATLEEIIKAAKETHAHSFIRRLEHGYDTVIGDDGGSLSQGQKQLLCITRIMLSLPPMLILDEATSSIDTRTEIKIQNAFEKLMKGKTSFIIAHRLSTIKNADVILVMRDGHIIESGKHDELIANKGFYYNLYNSQYGMQK